MIHFVRMNLEAEGARVVEAHDGLQALDKIREQLPHAVILDVMMPNLDGFETLKLIRESFDIPVIMLTVRADEEERVRGLELGADDYMGKPFSPRELVARIKAALRRLKSEGEVQTGTVLQFQHIRVDTGSRPAPAIAGLEPLRPLIHHAAPARAGRDHVILDDVLHPRHDVRPDLAGGRRLGDPGRRGVHREEDQLRRVGASDGAVLRRLGRRIGDQLPAPGAGAAGVHRRGPHGPHAEPDGAGRVAELRVRLQLRRRPAAPFALVLTVHQHVLLRAGQRFVDLQRDVLLQSVQCLEAA